MGALWAWGGAGFVETADAGLRAGRLDVVEDLVTTMGSARPAEISRALGAQVARFGARLAAARGDDAAVEPGFEEAAELFREIGFRFWLAVALLEHGEWLVEQHRV